MLLDALIERLVVTYGTQVPVEKGKWRVIERYIASKRLTRYTPGDLTRVRRGHFTFDLDRTDYVDQWIYLTNFYERDDYLHLLEGVVPDPGCVAFDVGAHIGFYTLGLARAVGTGGTVHAFEPNARSFTRLREHVLGNAFRNVVLNQVALGVGEGRARLRTPRRWNTGGATLLPVELPEAWENASFMVRTTSMDAYCREQRIARLDVVKVDCEGYEPHVIEGGMEALRRWRPRLLIEFNCHRLAATGWSGGRLLRLLRQLRYDTFRLRRGKLVQVVLVDEASESFNLHCLPAGSGNAR